jgi:hydroxymethylpyrimidine pyrophosphatase-like HAD family hydrolase
MNSIIKSNNILDIYEDCKNLIDNNNNVILFLDIDDTVLSSKNGVKFVDKNIKLLINLIYNHDARKLYFLTARDYDLKRKTLNCLNRAKIVHNGKYIYYNVIHSPYKIENNTFLPTKGETLIHFLDNTTLLSNDKPNYIIFVDDDIEQINCVNVSLRQYQATNFINYQLYHYL